MVCGSEVVTSQYLNIPHLPILLYAFVLFYLSIYIYGGFGFLALVDLVSFFCDASFR